MQSFLDADEPTVVRLRLRRGWARLLVPRGGWRRYSPEGRGRQLPGASTLPTGCSRRRPEPAGRASPQGPTPCRSRAARPSARLFVVAVVAVFGGSFDAVSDVAVTPPPSMTQFHVDLR
ncbi:MAG: hypothetical protein R3A48_11230 [Polyangiales bacterium]